MINDKCKVKAKLLYTLKAWPVITIVVIGLSLLTKLAAESLGFKLPEQAGLEEIKAMAGWNVRFIVNCFLVLVAAPIGEEFLFRYLGWKLPRKFLRIKPAIIAAFSAALFMGAHYIQRPFPDAAFLALFAFGLAQIWLYKKTNALWCPILFHSLFNLTNLVLLFVVPENCL